jgi:ATP-dependent RNA helicase RhlB
MLSKALQNRRNRTGRISEAKRRRKVRAPFICREVPVESKVPVCEGRKTGAEKPEEQRKQAPAQRKQRRRKQQWTKQRFKVEPVQGKTRFHDFDIPPSVMHGVADLDFKYCTAIQQEALPVVLAGRDMTGRASTGMGKSAVFLVAVFSRLLRKRQEKRKPGCPQALVIAPTRELVIQIAKDARAIGKYTPLRVAAVYGGTDYQKQMQDLRRRPVDIIVATPGRLLDFVSKKIVKLHQTTIMVLDEADRMLDMGFIPDVRRIIFKLPCKEKRQTLLFSATITEDVKRLADQWCVTPEFIETEKEQVAVESVEQIVYMTTSEEKYYVLYNVIKSQSHERIIVFTNMKRDAKSLSQRLQKDGIQCVLLSGDVPQEQRSKRLERFRNGQVEVMIATDVAGRGIHIDGISHVINYTLPYEPEDYVHRIGRTGRAGAKGISISFADEKGAFYIPEIEEFLGVPMPCVQPEESLLQPPPARNKRNHKR